MTPTDFDSLSALAETTAVECLTRRDGVVWSHGVRVRAGKRCPAVIELTCCHAIKPWATRLANALDDAGLRVVVGRCVPTYHQSMYGCSARRDGLQVWISVLGSHG